MAPSGRGSVKYGSPLFCARWASAAGSGAAPAAPAALVPEKKAADEAAPEKEEQEKVKETVARQETVASAASSSKPLGTGAVAVIGGGGGGGKHGVPNRLMCVEYRDGALAEEASATLSTADESPQLLALHPDGTTLICATSTRCRAYDVRVQPATGDKDKDVSKWLAERTSTASTSASSGSLTALNTIGIVRSLAFAPKGDRLAAGTEEGRLYIVKWPSMALVLDKQKAHAAAVTDIDLSADGTLLASTSTDKQCMVWSLPDGSMKALLNDEKGEFRGCRFSPDGASLFVVLNEGKKASIIQWDTFAWIPVRRVVAHTDRITAFTMSRSGRFLASGTVDGDVAIFDTTSLSVVMRVKRAHSFFVTSMDISSDDRLLLSASVDASARVTAIKQPIFSANMKMVFLALLVVLLAWILRHRSQATSRG